MSGLRSADASYRLGGEELVFLMPETDGEMARAAAEGLRRLVMETPIKFDGVDIAVTASFGVAELSPQDNDLSEMPKRADEATRLKVLVAIAQFGSTGKASTS